MKEQMEKRLEDLKNELTGGERLLAELQSKQATVQQTMLRISGAIQVLQELLGPEAGVKDGSASTAHGGGSASP